MRTKRNSCILAAHLAVGFAAMSVGVVFPAPAAAKTLTARWLADAERWNGKIALGNTQLDIVLELTRGDQPSATLAIPLQGLRATPVKDLKIQGDSVAFTLAVDNMPEAAFPKFELNLPGDKNAGDGVMLQSGMRVAVTMKRLAEGESGGPTRPQHPKPPFLYTARDVTFPNAESGGMLAGTLTVPEKAKFGTGPHPAVVLITGSGPQDRDETLFGHKPFLVIAHDLTSRGVAVLRVDDRGVGGSTSPKEGKETTDDFVLDALAALTFLKAQAEIDGSRLGLIGHSEGGIVAPMAAARSKDVAFIALLAGSGVSGREVLEEQMIAILQASGAPGEVTEKIAAGQKKVFSAVAAGASQEEIDGALRELITAQSGGVTDETMKAAKAQMDAPWMRRFLVLDPRNALRDVKCPVLVMNGGSDTQVIARQNVPVIVSTLLDSGNTDVTVRVLPRLNHLFQTATTGALSEYAQIEETFAPVALEVLGNWVVEKAGVRAAPTAR